MTFYFGPTPILAPNQITGLVAWYKADTGVYSDAGVTPATNGGTVQQWNDQSGNGYHLKQATAGNRPTYRTTSFNGKTTLEFDYSINTALATDTNAVMLNTSTISLFMVIRQLAKPASWSAYISFLANGDTSDESTLNSFSTWHHNTNDALEIWMNNHGYASQIAGYDTPERTGFIVNSLADVTAYINGKGFTEAEDVSWTFGGANHNGTLAVGRDETQASAAHFSGYISEIAFYNTEITGEEIGLLDAYFIDKWSF